MIVSLVISAGIIVLGAFIDKENIETYVTAAVAITGAVGLPAMLMKIVENENKNKEPEKSEPTSTTEQK